jgi:DNA-binding XRE family transcriptional regulator
VSYESNTANIGHSQAPVGVEGVFSLESKPCSQLWLFFQALSVKMAVMNDFARTFSTLDEWEQQIGTAIRRLRLEAELDQLELAVRANVSRSAVQSLERGKGSRLQTLLAVLRALDRTDALDGIMPPDGPTPLEVLAATRRTAAAPQRFRKPGR